MRNTFIDHTLASVAHARRALSALVAAVLASSAAYAADPDQLCQQGRYKAAAKYTACQQKVLAKLFAGATVDYPGDLSKCRVKYAAAWPKLQAKAAGTGATCDNARFEDNMDGTATDRLTGLQWEKKTDDATVHDKDNVYGWSAGGGGFTAADGTAFTSFLATLNGGGCFAGQCDWRLPTFYELLTILLEPIPCTTSPCIDQTVFGPTVAGSYWSATTSVDATSFAWVVYFFDGSVFGLGKNLDNDVRAVRGGL